MATETTSNKTVNKTVYAWASEHYCRNNRLRNEWASYFEAAKTAARATEICPTTAISAVALYAVLHRMGMDASAAFLDATKAEMPEELREPALALAAKLPQLEEGLRAYEERYAEKQERRAAGGDIRAEVDQLVATGEIPAKIGTAEEIEFAVKFMSGGTFTVKEVPSQMGMALLQAAQKDETGRQQQLLVAAYLEEHTQNLKLRAKCEEEERNAKKSRATDEQLARAAQEFAEITPEIEEALANG